ncbi:MAG: antitoxin component YwqK of YwqJK toxin-antitoxin module [Crocinitomix sp.]|jgi:antitoxin component YwqK of YwqJK toxin-antitoxin module
MKNQHYIFICLTFILIACNNSIDNSNKRNADWVWSIDEAGNNGQWVPNGNDNNVQDGLITTFYDNGNTCYKTRIRANVRIDTTWYYDFEVNNELIKIYTNKDGAETWQFPRNGPYKRYFQSGLLQEEGFISNFQKGHFWIVYAADGTIIYREFNDTTLNKSSISNYYPNGNIKDSTITVNDILEGTSIDWYENGIIERIDSWSNGERDGIIKSFYPSGQLESISFAKKGQKEGPYLKYYESGILKMESRYEDGVRHGILSKYYTNGKIEDSLTFIEGNQEGPFYKYYDSGSKYFEGQLTNGKVSGTWFYTDEKLFSTCIYNETQSQGLITYYTKSKKPFFIETIADNIITDLDTLFDYQLTEEEQEKFDNRRKN